MVPSNLPEALSALHSLNFEIAMASGRKDAVETRKSAYQQFLDEAEIVNQVFEEDICRIRLQSPQANLIPSMGKRLTKMIADAKRDLSLMTLMITNATLRVIEEKDVPSKDRLASVTDSDAAFISKGQRETVVGYRPQVSKSGRGFVTGLIVPEGNAADAGQAMPLYRQTVARTGVTPKVMSWDDGYTSANNLADLLDKGVKVVSFSGSKGKKVTPSEAWESEPYAEARRMRSSVESVIYQLKQGFGFGRMMRRGIRKVREELTTKILAFNFFRVQYLLR
jgi:IS5 family transposase